MKRLAFLLLGLAACSGDSTAPRLTAAHTEGQWTAHVAPAPGCWTRYTFFFDITAEDVTSLSSDGKSFTIARSGWTIGGSDPLPFEGTIRLDGQHSSITFWKHVGTAGGVVDAVLARDGSHMTGTFTDVGNAFSLDSPCSAAFDASK